MGGLIEELCIQIDGFCIQNEGKITHQGRHRFCGVVTEHAVLCPLRLAFKASFEYKIHQFQYKIHQILIQNASILIQIATLHWQLVVPDIYKNDDSSIEMMILQYKNDERLIWTNLRLIWVHLVCSSRRLKLQRSRCVFN